MWLTPSQKKGWGQKKKVCHHWGWDRDAKEINHWAPRVWLWGQQRSMRCGAYRELGHRETIHHRLKVSCSLETRRWGCGSETEIEEGQQNCEQHEGTSRTSAALNASLYLAITALRASPDEKTRAKKKEAYLKAGTFYLRKIGNQSQTEPLQLLRRGTHSDSS